MPEPGQQPICQVCGSKLSSGSEICPVCAFRGAIGSASNLGEFLPSDFQFEHYEVLKNEAGTPVELGRGAMGVTYKAFDERLHRLVALKIIRAGLIGDESAQQRFVREARAAARVRHPNVAAVFHLGGTGADYFYAMEFVEGETVEKLISHSGRLKSSIAFEVVRQVTAGLSAIYKQNLVHRDIKPSNIIVNLEDSRPETVKIIDLGLAKGIAEEGGVSAIGVFVGTPAYASPEQFAGIGIDIRSDLYSLGIMFWEMLTGDVPFKGSSSELVYQHQHFSPPVGRLAHIPQPFVPLLELMLEKKPALRFQTPNHLSTAITIVTEAIGSGHHLTKDELASTVANRTPSKLTPGQSSADVILTRKRNPVLRWLIVLVVAAALLLGGVLLFHNRLDLATNPPTGAAIHLEKSIAVLPFPGLSPNKDDSYFADGVQDEILNDLAKIAELKVISRTSVMQYRGEEKRDLRQIASELGVANVLEGTVRRVGDRVRVSVELVDARNDHTIWADSYDRALTDIFRIQSEVAQIIAAKLTATLSLAEKQNIENRPTENLEAYDRYLQAKELLTVVKSTYDSGDVRKPLVDAVDLLEQAVRLDPKFTLAYCAAVEAHDFLYRFYDPSPQRLILGDAAVKRALELQPDLPEVRLAYALHLYQGYRDYEHARIQLAIARRGLPNDTEAMSLEASMDRRQGQFEKAIQAFKDAVARDPHNSGLVEQLAFTLQQSRRFREAEQMFDRLVELVPDEPILKTRKPLSHYLETGDDSAVRSAIAAFPPSLAADKDALCFRLDFACFAREWPQAEEIIEKLKGGDDEGDFAYGQRSVPIGCYSILIARLKSELPGAKASFSETREQLNQKVQESPQNAPLLSQLAVVDALLDNKEIAIAGAKKAVEMLPISEDAMEGPCLELNLAVVYCWTNHLDLAFEKLSSLTKVANGILYGQLKWDPLWEPLRQDARYQKLLAELAPPH